jgi:hypothetical protein
MPASPARASSYATISRSSLAGTTGLRSSARVRLSSSLLRPSQALRRRPSSYCERSRVCGARQLQMLCPALSERLCRSALVHATSALFCSLRRRSTVRLKQPRDNQPASADKKLTSASPASFAGYLPAPRATRHSHGSGSSPEQAPVQPRAPGEPQRRSPPPRTSPRCRSFRSH